MTVNTIKDILIAEDDIDDVEILTAALQETGMTYVIRHAPNGERLFVLLKDKLPYILFLDIHMPCKDGLSCVLEIRKDRAYDKLPVIMYSSYKQDTIVDQSFINGANFYLPKPHHLSELSERLKKLFSIDWHNHIYYPTKDKFVL